MRNNKKILFFSALSAVIAVFFPAKFTRANSMPHLIINEIQSDGSGKNEFVEIYNPTDAPIDLSGHKLTKKTRSGTESALLSQSKFSGLISARGYFLIAHPDYKDTISADLSYSGSTYYITDDNTVLLYGKGGTLLDKAGYGLATDYEASPIPNPASDQSIERHDFSDTDNNASDFSINPSPSPRNSEYSESTDEELQNENDNQNNTPENTCATSSTEIRLSEIFPYPSTGEEFVEIKNTGATCVDVSGWKIMDGSGHKKEFPKNSILEPGKYLCLSGNLFLNNDSDTVRLLDRNGGAETDALDSQFFEKAKRGFSYALADENWLWTSISTPGVKNAITTPEPDTDGLNDSDSGENISLSDKISLNEIFPNPKEKADEEYIEIKNNGNDPVDLYKWTLSDASKNGKYVFKEHTVIAPGEYMSIRKSQSKISLNDSAESVYLRNPKNNPVSSVSYEKSRKGASYNFDGENWRWSKYPTPGEKNKLDSEPKIKLTKPKKVYRDIAADFSATAKDKETKKLKYIWDFGDGKKSYAKETSHKYTATGKYTVTLSVSDESQTIKKNFVIKVKNSSLPDLEIVKILPNPAGKDNEGEIINIRNNSKKEVDLSGWKVATGSNERMYNHPISGKLFLEPGKTGAVGREFSKFSLNNKAGKVALVSPDGKIIDKIEYSKEKITDDEAYEKINGEWQWILSGMEKNSQGINGENEFIEDPTGEMQATEENDANESIDNEDGGEVLGAADENYTAGSQSNFASEDAYIFLNKIYPANPPAEPNYCPLNDSSFSIAYLLASTI